MTLAPNPSAPDVPATAPQGPLPPLAGSAQGLPVGLFTGLAGAPASVASAVQSPPPPTVRSQPLTIALGVVLIGGLVALMLIISLRLIRRVAEGSPLAAERQRKRKPRGAGRDPWREAGRRLVVPPKERDENEEGPSDGPSDPGGEEPNR